MRQQGAHGDQIQHADGKIAQQGTDGGAHNADMRIAGEDEHRAQLQQSADEHVDDGAAGVAMGLHDGGGHQNHGVEHNGEAQDRHQSGGKDQVLSGVTAQQCGDGLCQHSQAEGAGHGDQSGDPGCGFGGIFGILLIAQGQLGSDGGNDGDGDGGDEGAGHIEDGLGHAVDAPHGVGSGLGIEFQQAAHVDLGFQHGKELQTGTAQGDGNGNDHQTLGGICEGTGFIAGLGHLGESCSMGLEVV